MTDPTDAELRALCDAATPGPWDHDNPDANRREIVCETMYGPDNKSLFDTLNSEAACIHEDHDEDGSSYWDETGRRNFAFIAAARTALPRLLNERDELVARADAADKYLDESVQERLDEIDAEAEAFNKDCCNSLRWLLTNKCGDAGHDLVTDVDGWSADQAGECIAECMNAALADIRTVAERIRPFANFWSGGGSPPLSSADWAQLPAALAIAEKHANRIPAVESGRLRAPEPAVSNGQAGDVNADEARSATTISTEQRGVTAGETAPFPAPDALGERAWLAPWELSDRQADIANSVTASWLDIKGSGLTIAREKMKRRFARLRDAVLASGTSPGPSPVAGMETTAEERERWMEEPEYSLRETQVNRLLRDIDRLTAALAEAKAEREDESGSEGHSGEEDGSAQAREALQGHWRGLTTV